MTCGGDWKGIGGANGPPMPRIVEAEGAKGASRRRRLQEEIGGRDNPALLAAEIIPYQFSLVCPAQFHLITISRCPFLRENHPWKAKEP